MRKMCCSTLLGVLFLLGILIADTQGHGMMLDPVGRSSRWRYNSSAPPNYDDNANFCGGYGVQWYTNDGKCGVCGDDYGLTPPRPNELGGIYGEGVITKTYKDTYTAEVTVDITANHLGFIYFNLCNLDAFVEESEECYLHYRLQLADGSDKLYIGTTTGLITTTVVFPEDLSCQHCVLRWTYNTGNNWGYCEDGTGALGCGAQEYFKSCADISISAPTSRQRLSNRLEESAEQTEVEVPVGADYEK